MSGRILYLPVRCADNLNGLRMRPSRRCVCVVVLLALSLAPAATPSRAQGSGPPQIEPVATAGLGTGVWLFVVDDRSALPAVSSGGSGSVQIARLDVDTLRVSGSWQVVAGAGDTGGTPIADHWHIFAHGFHWIAFSSNRDNDSYLLKLDTNFTRRALLRIVRDGADEGQTIRTNDMFLVAEADGVTVGHFRPGFGHRLFRFDTAGALRGTIDIGGDGFRHGNGASAMQTPSGFLVLAPETLAPNVTSGLKKIEFSSTWEPLGSVLLVHENAVNYAMASGVLLETGFLVVHVRMREGVTPQGEPAPPLDSNVDDSGALVRLIIAPDGTVAARDVLQTSSVNRPHTTLIGTRLITGWDERASAAGGPVSLRLRVDRIQP